MFTNSCVFRHTVFLGSKYSGASDSMLITGHWSPTPYPVSAQNIPSADDRATHHIWKWTKGHV